MKTPRFSLHAALPLLAGLVLVTAPLHGQAAKKKAVANKPAPTLANVKYGPHALGIECTVRHRDEGANADGEMVEFFGRHLAPGKGKP